MASEYYKWLARDVKPEEPKELTREEKRKNWWDYHKVHVVVGVLCVIFLANIGYDVWQNAANQPDYCLAYVGTSALPEDTIDALETAFAALGEDLNGNGQVQVELLTYRTGQSNDASLQLIMNIETVESMIFLLEDPEAFAASYPVLVSVDGVKPEETEEALWMYYRWADCPVLAGLDLPMADLCVARRGLWGEESTDAILGALRLWETMTAGAN